MKRDAAELHKLNQKARVAVVPNGVDLDYFQPLPTLKSSFSFFMDTCATRPIPTAFYGFVEKVFPLVREAILGVTLLVPGKEPPPEVVALARISGIEFLGYVPDMRPYLARSNDKQFNAGIFYSCSNVQRTTVR
ncbi:MAG: glycosyltransferase [Armatimonadetes bacterium]|nr:glycosyltransferase [Armatimonadota bacterium]